MKELRLYIPIDRAERLNLQQVFLDEAEARKWINEANSTMARKVYRMAIVECDRGDAFVEVREV